MSMIFAILKCLVDITIADISIVERENVNNGEGLVQVKYEKEFIFDQDDCREMIRAVIGEFCKKCGEKWQCVRSFESKC